MQFRAEAFNIFNHAQFTFNTPSGTPGGNIDNTGIFGFVNTSRDPRIMQLALKFLF